MEGLGRLYDIRPAFVPTDAVAGAITGLRCHLKNASGCAIVMIAAAGSTDILDLDVQQHTASTGGTTADLDVVTHYYHQSETTLDGDEVWTRVNQSAASEITDIGTASTQNLAVVEVDATSLSDGYEWISVNVPDLGTNGTKFVAGIYILRDLMVQRAPASLIEALS